MALRFSGRLMVTIATPSVTAYSISSLTVRNIATGTGAASSRTRPGRANGSACLTDQPLGRGVRHGAEVLAEHAAENRLVRRGVPEERHGGTQFHGVDAAENGLGRPARQGREDPRALEQSRAKNRMRQVGPGLVERPDGVVLRCRAVAQA